MRCRHCEKPLEYTALDLGFAPPSNAYLTAEDLNKPEKYYPLRLKVCDRCWLVQTEDYADADDLFTHEYAYFSSTSTSWLRHAQDYCNAITHRLGLSDQSFVVEIASNDGYLLKNFAAVKIRCLGIEPTASTAAAAEAIGVPVLREFFGEALGQRLASEGNSADLVIGNNVYAHVPDINDFTRGLKAILKPGGTITLEFPHLLRMILGSQFDTVYHEHFSYLSLWTVQRIFAAAGLRLFDVDELTTHGGSLRVYGCHYEDPRLSTDSVDRILEDEERYQLRTLGIFRDFQTAAERIKDDLLMFLIDRKRAGKKVVAYGAAAKGNTLLNFAGVKSDLLPIVFDAAPSKQNRFMPGSQIPIRSPDDLTAEKTDYVLILPWNIADEVVQKIRCLVSEQTHYLIAIPVIKVTDLGNHSFK
jgi:SAM-dependent methyltransferase